MLSDLIHEKEMLPSPPMDMLSCSYPKENVSLPRRMWLQRAKAILHCVGWGSACKMRLASGEQTLACYCDRVILSPNKIGSFRCSLLLIPPAPAPWLLAFITCNQNLSSPVRFFQHHVIWLISHGVKSWWCMLTIGHIPQGKAIWKRQSDLHPSSHIWIYGARLRE